MISNFGVSFSFRCIYLYYVRLTLQETVSKVYSFGGSFSIKGDFNKKAAQKFYKKLPAGTKQEIADILFKLTPESIVSNFFDIMEILFLNLTWNTFKDSFSDMGWWDATTFVFGVVSTITAGPIVLTINAGLIVYDAGKLIHSIATCNEGFMKRW